MNKKILVLIAIVIIAVAAGGWILFGKDKDSKNNSETAKSNASSTNNSGPIDVTANTLRGLLSLNGATMCTFSDQESSGTVYIAGENRMRYDYTSTDPNEPAGSMIIDSGNMYLWDTTSTEGIKTSYDPATLHENTDANESQDTDESANLDQEHNFSCERWRTDQSKFTPPSNITFTDMEALLQQSQQ